MQHEYLQRSVAFLESSEDFNDGDRVILGLPMDITTSFRPGTRMAPNRVREMALADSIEEYSMALDKSLTEVEFYDTGDVQIVHGNVEESLRRIKLVAESLVRAGKKVFAIGGEHLVSLPMVQAYYQQYPDLVVIQFDAHLDLREDYEGERFSHATVMRRILEVIGDHNLFQLGIRSGDREELKFARDHSNLYIGKTIEVINDVIRQVGDRPVYISLDIDVLDPAFAPGTGTPETDGTTSRELMASLYALAQLNVVGFDMVEISPPLETGDITSILGAKILREALLMY